MGFEFIEGLTRADVAFKADGRDLAELFTSSNDALLSILLENSDNIDFIQTREFTIEDSSIEYLIYDYLQEIIFYKDSESLLLKTKQIEIKEKAGIYHLKCCFSGETINNKKHSFITDIKAITMHNLEVQKKGDLWYAIIIVDV